MGLTGFIVVVDTKWTFELNLFDAVCGPLEFKVKLFATPGE